MSVIGVVESARYPPGYLGKCIVVLGGGWRLTIGEGRCAKDGDG